MALAVNDIILTTIRGTCFGQRIIFTMTWFVSEAFESDTTRLDLLRIAEVIAAPVPAALLTKYLACLPADYTANEIRVQRLRPTRSAYSVLSLAGRFGTHAEVATVANDSAALTLRTPFAGRDQVATKHIGPIPDAVSSEGLLTDGYKAILNTLGQELSEPVIPVLPGGEITPCIFNRNANAAVEVVQFAIGDQSRVQRRRTVGLGE